MIEAKFTDIVKYVETGIEALRRTGLTVLEFRDGHAKLLMPLEGNVNHIGMMYAGSLFSLGEVAGGAIFGAAFDFTKYLPIVKEVTIKYRKPALTDITLVVEMEKQYALSLEKEVEEKGKADFPLELELKNSSDETVAEVRGTWQLRKIPEGMNNPVNS